MVLIPLPYLQNSDRSCNGSGEFGHFKQLDQQVGDPVRPWNTEAAGEVVDQGNIEPTLLDLTVEGQIVLIV